MFTLIPLICDPGSSKSVDSSTTSIIKGVLPHIAPEVLYLLKNLMFILGIIMHQIANGELPFRNYSFDDECLAMRICDGLRPKMPDSAPNEYKKLAENCCDADPNNRPRDGDKLYTIINDLIKEIKDDDDVWNTIYCNKNIRPLSRIEKESKYSSRLLPTGNLPKPRNSI